MKPIGTFAGAHVSLDYSDGVRIVMEWTPKEGNQTAIAGLGQALGGFARLSWDDGVCRAEICYTEALDRCLMTLIDMLISIRYSHPTVTQLELDLTPQEATGMVEAMNG